MRSAILLAPLTALVLVLPAQAQQPTSATRNMPVTGSVPRTCAIQPGRIQPGGLNNIAGLDGDTLRIIQFTDPATLAVRAASATINFEAVCNFPHQVRIESKNNGLWPVDERISDRASGFAYAVPYTAEIRWGPITGRMATTGKLRVMSQRVFPVENAVAGDFNLRIAIEEGASNVEIRAPLVAGTYVDTVRIFLEPR
ncbi:MAG: hypothetical protein C0515_04845 [Novosphingobium sp.]|nr:hypothetical protein [Novosphingobium sp.]MBX9644492.1 hypothetical protein [Novosphingobium sp.]